MKTDDVTGKAVIEVGSRDVNGSAQPYLRSLEPSRYVGIDVQSGPGVDEICDAGAIVERFGAGSFDVLVSTELVEHVRDWQRTFLQMKTVLRPGGVLVVTTRSPGFHVHGYPYDFWRYTMNDMEAIFSDFADVRVEPDTLAPGVFVRAIKPADWEPTVSRRQLYSVITQSDVDSVTDLQVAQFKVRYHAHRAYRRMLPESIRAPIKRLLIR